MSRLLTVQSAALDRELGYPIQAVRGTEPWVPAGTRFILWFGGPHFCRTVREVRATAAQMDELKRHVRSHGQTERAV